MLLKHIIHQLVLPAHNALKFSYGTKKKTETKRPAKNIEHSEMHTYKCSHKYARIYEINNKFQ